MSFLNDNIFKYHANYTNVVYKSGSILYEGKIYKVCMNLKRHSQSYYQYFKSFLEMITEYVN